MDVSDARRLKTFEDDDGKLKRLVADAMMDNTVLKDLLSKNGKACCEAYRINRLYREEGLDERKRQGRTQVGSFKASILVEARPNAGWSLDFVHDQIGQRSAMDEP